MPPPPFNDDDDDVRRFIDGLSRWKGYRAISRLLDSGAKSKD
jgi:hypothetical protein